tara:strand:- start:156 stop:620 length:465 start_codon:yes stop_codon:yes gene_type:complete
LLIIILSIFIGLLLSLTTLPLGYYSPEWLLLVNMYWAMALPSNNKMILAFLSGLLFDVIMGQVLGISALLYVLFIYLTLRLYNFLRYMTVFQQAIIFFVLLILKLALFVWISYIVSISIDYQSQMLGILSTVFFWPPIFYFLRYIRRKFQVREE